LRHRLTAALAALQSDPSNSALQGQVCEIVDRLQGFKRRKVDGQRIRSRIKWMKVGDSGSKDFYRAHKHHAGASRITALDDADGVSHLAQPEMEHLCREYYSKFYTREPISLAQEGAREQALACIRDCLSEEMKACLRVPIKMHELDEALKGMAAGKSPGPDGIVIEFYKTFWDLFGEKYHRMILSAVESSRLPNGVTRGLISLLHKGGGRSSLTNWHPITLLNVGYKLFAKVLQLRLQPMLMEIISLDQSAFLPMRFILDNILLTHETIEWAEYSNQPLIFFKLDFSKAYDMVDHTFLFGAMEKFGFPREFVGMTSLLFQDAMASVKINGAQTTTFEIQQGVRQGCPLAPYLFLIVAEVMNAMIKLEVASGTIKGTKLPVDNMQQVVAQYADDTSLTLLGEEESVRRAIYILEVFYASSGMVLNWIKSCAYWKLAGGSPRPRWTEFLGILWAEDDEISKLLGTAFGTSLLSGDIDNFLLARINKSLGYWSTTKINATGRRIIVNGVLLSSTYYFTSIWGGTKRGVSQVKSAVTNYFWSGSLQRSKSKVLWLHCCQTKANGGVNLIHPLDAMVALMVKWIMKAVEPGDSNLHLMLRYRLAHFQPYSSGRWAPSLEFFTLPKFKARRGSPAWTRVGSAWRPLVKELLRVRPISFEEVMSEPFWWSEFSTTIGPGFSKLRATQLHRAGLQHIRDAWEEDQFISAARAVVKFGLL
jgi:hypothetical protein